MKRLVWFASLLLLTLIGVASLRGTASAASCSMTSTSLSDLIAAYDPVKSNASTNLTAGPAMTFTCTGITSNTVVKIFVSGTASLPASYTTPFLTGPNNFQLPYSLCTPKSGTCTASTGTIWNSTNAYNVNLKSTDSGNVQTIPAPSIFLGQHDAYVGTISDYTGNLFFYFVCGSPAVAC